MVCRQAVEVVTLDTSKYSILVRWYECLYALLSWTERGRHAHRKATMSINHRIKWMPSNNCILCHDCFAASSKPSSNLNHDGAVEIKWLANKPYKIAGF